MCVNVHASCARRGGAGVRALQGGGGQRGADSRAHGGGHYRAHDGVDADERDEQPLTHGHHPQPQAGGCTQKGPSLYVFSLYRVVFLIFLWGKPVIFREYFCESRSERAFCSRLQSSFEKTPLLIAVSWLLMPLLHPALAGAQ